MTLAIVFWICFLIAIVIGNWGPDAWKGRAGILYLILFAVLGWQVFGPAIHR